MHTFRAKRLYASIFALALALVVGLATYISAAAGPPPGTATLDILDLPKTASCATEGTKSASVVQENPVKFSLAGYDKNEAIALYFTFPDGRVLDIPGVLALDGPLNTANTKLPNPLSVDEGGDLFFVYNISSKWPVGCYAISSLGLSSGKNMVTYLEVKAPPAPAVVGTAVLTVLDPAASATVGVRGAIVDMHGTGFKAGEKVSVVITTPTGTKIDFPDHPVTSPSGDFTSSFKFSDVSVIGKYHFTVTGQDSGYQAGADFVIMPPPGGAAGVAMLATIVSTDKDNPLSHRVEIQGTQFQPLEGVTLKLSSPAGPILAAFGGTITLPVQHVNKQGKFVIALLMDQNYPAGTYLLTAEGSDGKELATAPFTIPAAPGVGTSTSVLTDTMKMTATTAPSTTTSVTPSKTSTAAPSTTTTAAPSVTSTAVPSTTSTTMPSITSTAVPATAVPASPTTSGVNGGTASAVISVTQTSGDTDSAVIIIYNPQNSAVGQVVPVAEPATDTSMHNTPQPPAANPPANPPADPPADPPAPTPTW